MEHLRSGGIMPSRSSSSPSLGAQAAGLECATLTQLEIPSYRLNSEESGTNTGVQGKFKRNFIVIE
jgi:hypothetical protein